MFELQMEMTSLLPDKSGSQTSKTGHYHNHVDHHNHTHSSQEHNPLKYPVHGKCLYTYSSKPFDQAEP